jgi:hypothetical protein
MTKDWKRGHPNKPGIYQVRVQYDGEWRYPQPQDVPVLTLVKPKNQLGMWMQYADRTEFVKVETAVLVVRNTLPKFLGPAGRLDKIGDVEFARIGDAPTAGLFFDGVDPKDSGAGS